MEIAGFFLSFRFYVKSKLVNLEVLIFAILGALDFVDLVYFTQCGNYGNLLTHIRQKFRENNVFTKEVTKELI